MSATIQVLENTNVRNTAENEMLTAKATEFLRFMERRFRSKRADLLCERNQRQAQFDQGYLPRFHRETLHIREAEWTVAAIPTGPARSPR